MTGKIILTGDKTLIKAKYLIDDNPEITGANKSPE
jgi:5'(3')-deoxyribonucleotidase